MHAPGWRPGAFSTPQVGQALGGERRLTARGLKSAMSPGRLDRPGRPPVVGQRQPAGMTEPRGMHRTRAPCDLASPPPQLAHRACGQRPAPCRDTPAVAPAVRAPVTDGQRGGQVCSGGPAGTRPGERRPPPAHPAGPCRASASPHGAEGGPPCGPPPGLARLRGGADLPAPVLRHGSAAWGGLDRTCGVGGRPPSSTLPPRVSRSSAQRDRLQVVSVTSAEGRGRLHARRPWPPARPRPCTGPIRLDGRRDPG